MKTLLHLFFALMLLSPLTMRGEDVSFTVNVDNPDAVKFTLAGTEQTLVAGDNQMTGTVSSVVRIDPTPGFFIQSVIGPDGYPLSLMANLYCMAYIYPNWDGATLTVTTIREDEKYPLSCTLKVDNASKVSAYTMNFRDITLVDGEQTLRFSADDNQLAISSRSFSEPVYKVFQNGTPVEGSGSYLLTLAQDDYIEIQAEAPAVYYKLKLAFANEGSEKVLEKFWVGDELISDLTPYLTGDGVDVKGNSTVQFSFNTNDYKINSVKLNGSPLDLYMFRIEEASNVVIDARLWEHPTKKVYIEGADNLEMYNGYGAYGGIPVEIKEGLNEITYAEDYTPYCVLPKRDCYLTELRMGDKDLFADWSLMQPSFDISQEGDLYIKAGRYEFDKQFILYIDDLEAANFGWSFFDAKYQPIDVESGYNTVGYYDLISPFDISAMPFEGTPVMYLNDELLTDGQRNDYQWILTPEVNSVYKLFIASKPEKFDFSVTNDEGVDVTVRRDIVVDVSDFSKPLSLLPGTRIDIEAPQGSTVAVSLNGAEPVVTDKFSTEVNEAGSLAITKVVGIDAVSADAEVVPVYNLQGIRLTDSDKLNTLPAGMYIVGGRKIVRK